MCIVHVDRQLLALRSYMTGICFMWFAGTASPHTNPRASQQQDTLSDFSKRGIVIATFALLTSPRCPYCNRPENHVIFNTQAYLMSHRADISPVSILRRVAPTWSVRVIKGRPGHRPGIVHLALGYSRLAQRVWSTKVFLPTPTSILSILFRIFTTTHHAQTYQQPC